MATASSTASTSFSAAGCNGAVGGCPHRRCSYAVNLIAAAVSGYGRRMVRHFLSPVVTKAVAGLVVGCALVLPARAHAQTTAPPPAAASGGGGLGQGFGEAGQIVISGDRAGRRPSTWRRALRQGEPRGLDFDDSSGGGLLHHAGRVGRRPSSADRPNDASTRASLVGRTRRLQLQRHGATSASGADAGFAYDHVRAGTGARLLPRHVPEPHVPDPVSLVPHVFVGIGPYYNLKRLGRRRTTTTASPAPSAAGSSRSAPQRGGDYGAAIERLRRRWPRAAAPPGPSSGRRRPRCAPRARAPCASRPARPGACRA